MWYIVMVIACAASWGVIITVIMVSIPCMTLFLELVPDRPVSPILDHHTQLRGIALNRIVLVVLLHGQSAE